MESPHRFRVPGEVVRLLRGLHPVLKHKVRSAFDRLRSDPYSGKALQAELDGLRSLRVGRWRIVYRLRARRIIDILAVGPRERIYEETLRLISKG
jgi:mRNA interferase RelE/StbE